MSESIGKKFADGVSVNPVLNQNNDALPFGYYDIETDGQVYWVCGYDNNNRITSVFKYKDGDDQDQRVTYLDSIQEAIDIREQLKSSGWRAIEPKKMTFTYPGESTPRPMDRQIKRRLTRKIQHEAKMSAISQVKHK